MRANLQKARKAKGLTQQAVAEMLDISTRHYQRIENGDSAGTFAIWDTLEDITGIHQRVLREISSIDRAQADNQVKHPEYLRSAQE